MTEAESLVRALIDNFSVENLRRFLASKNRDFGLLATIQDLPQYADEEFSRVQELSEVTLDDGPELGVFVLQTAGEITERTSKKRQFEKAKKILRDELLDAGLFVFYGGNGNFRFSLVYQTTRGKKTEFSPYKRYTFYVVRGRPNRTFVKSMVALQLDTLEHLINAFDARPLTKEFYTEIQNWYGWALKHAKFPGGRNEENLIRLLSRLLFVWFLKERNLVPEEIFDEEFLHKVVKDFNRPDAANYYNAILQNLFFATLNRHANERRFAKDGTFYENRDEFGVKTLYRYQDLLRISEEEFVKIFEKVPMINGGLFECLDEDKEYIDGFSRNPQKRAKVPDFLFFSEGELVDLRDFYGEERTRSFPVRGLINILKEYDFTADENTPIDIEVSLNPELLGLILENLLAMYNPETSTTARKATGSYYTPQWVVDFMVDEALIAYLQDKTGLSEEFLRSLLTYDGQEVELDKESRRKIVEAIDSLKVIDPAVGSGAFPMGIVHKLVHILSVVDPHNDIWFDMQLNRLKRRIEMTVKEGDEKSVAELEQEIEKVFNEALYYPDYARKLYLIENSIYGVDIQPIAIQLCKLRFFLSLLVDQKVDWSKPDENYGIRPLPHLETKFVAANTLIHLSKPGQMVFISEEVRRLMNRLKELYHKHFLVKTREEKVKLQEEAAKVRDQLRQTLIAERWPRDVADKVASVDIFSQTTHSEWFDPEWMLGVDEGFDIVIGNPPYIRQERIRDQKPILQEQGYETYTSTADLYVYFIERGYQLLRPGGTLSFITSNKWLRTKYGNNLRRFLKSRTTMLCLIDFGGYKVFDATVDASVFLFKKQRSAPDHMLKFAEIPADAEQPIEYVTTHWSTMSQANLSDDAWTLGDESLLRLKEKIERVGKPLKDWDVRIYRGILTGLNEAFIIDTETRDKILASCKTEEERKRTEAIIKPILRGRDIERYYYKWAGKWIIWAYQGIDIEQYPALLMHLVMYKDKLQLRTGGAKIAGDPKSVPYKWYELQVDYHAIIDEFEKEKIVWRRVTDNRRFAWVSPGIYCEATTHFIVVRESTDPNILWYLLGLLNSTFFEATFRYFYMGGGIEGEIKGTFLERFPAVQKTEKNAKTVSEIAYNAQTITEIKSQTPNADTSGLEREIDQLVYQLYGLTDGEIALIEEKVGG